MTASSSICSSSKARSSKRRHVQNCAYIICLTDRCRTLQFKKVYPDSYFNKSIIKISSVQSEENCQLECYFHAACKSYNLGPPTEQGRVCELSSSRHIFHSNHLIKRPNFIYRPSVVSSQSLVNSSTQVLANKANQTKLMELKFHLYRRWLFSFCHLSSLKHNQNMQGKFECSGCPKFIEYGDKSGNLGKYTWHQRLCYFIQKIHTMVLPWLLEFVEIISFFSWIGLVPASMPRRQNLFSRWWGIFLFLQGFRL